MGKRLHFKLSFKLRNNQRFEFVAATGCLKIIFVRNLSSEHEEQKWKIMHFLGSTFQFNEQQTNIPSVSVTNLTYNLYIWSLTVSRVSVPHKKACTYFQQLALKETLSNPEAVSF